MKPFVSITKLIQGVSRITIQLEELKIDIDQISKQNLQYQKQNESLQKSLKDKEIEISILKSELFLHFFAYNLMIYLHF